MQKKPLYILIALILVSILLYFNNNLPPVKFVASSVQKAFSAPKSFIYSLKIGSDNDENAQLQSLREENKALTEKLIEFERIKLDNEALRSQFETAETRTYDLLPARVIGFLGKFSFPTVLIIDKGNLDGVSPSMGVIFESNFIGKVRKVSGHYSEILLVTNPEFSGLARTSESNSAGIINGASDFVLFDRVDVNETLTVGELLFTKGEINADGIGIPPDLLIGKISSINKSESLPFQSAKVEVGIQASKLSSVFIVLSL